MPSSTSSSETFRLPWALLLALGLFLLSDQALWSFRPWLEFCARYASPFRHSDPLRTSVRIRLLPVRERSPTILLVGSSQILEGVECGPFVARFPGRTCVNLGILAGTPLDLLFLTDRLDTGLRRRVLITSVTPQTLHKPPRAAFSDTTTLRGLYLTGALFRMTPPEWIDIGLYGQVQNFCETLRMKDSLAEMWDIVGTDPLAALRFELPAQPPNTYDLKDPRPPKYFRNLMGVVDPEIVPGRFTPTHEWALDQVIRREARLGNPMIVVDFPNRRGYESTITPEAAEHYHRLVDRLAARGDVVMVRNEDLPPLSDDDFHDFAHVRASGRRLISEALADRLAGIERELLRGEPRVSDHEPRDP
jgi:hypothetical protein